MRRFWSEVVPALPPQPRRERRFPGGDDEPSKSIGTRVSARPVPSLRTVTPHCPFFHTKVKAPRLSLPELVGHRLDPCP